MKRIVIFVCTVCMLALLAVGCTGDKAELNTSVLTGKWRCELYGSELLIEFTPDNRFISHTDSVENLYAVEDGYIITYIDGMYDDGVKVEAYVKDDVLTYGGVEYQRVEALK